MMEKKRNRHVDAIILILFTLASYGFFGYNQFPLELIKISKFAAVTIMMICMYNEVRKKQKDFYFKIVKYIFYAYLLSIIISYSFEGQSLLLGYLATVPFLIIVLFFYLCKIDADLILLENFIWFLGSIYVVLWVYAFYKAPTIVFGFSDDMYDDLSRGMFRVRITGLGMAILCYFMSLNKLFVTKKNIYILPVVILYAVIFAQLTRIVIVSVSMITFVYIFFVNKKNAICLFLLFVFAIKTSSFFNKIDAPTINAMIWLTEKQLEENEIGEENVRITEYKYYFSNWHSNVLECIFGSGEPHSNSSYGKRDLKLKNNGLYRDDVGYAHIYTILGGWGLFCFILLFSKGTICRMPAHICYVNLYMAFLLFSSIAASWFWTSDVEVALSICAYMLMNYRIKHHKRV